MAGGSPATNSSSFAAVLRDLAKNAGDLEAKARVQLESKARITAAAGQQQQAEALRAAMAAQGDPLRGVQDPLRGGGQQADPLRGMSQVDAINSALLDVRKVTKKLYAFVKV